MNIFRVCFWDGHKPLIISFTSFAHLQGKIFTDIIEFFSESESRNFDIIVECNNKQLLSLNISRSVDLEQLLKLGASLYANNKNENNETGIG